MKKQYSSTAQAANLTVLYGLHLMLIFSFAASPIWSQTQQRRWYLNAKDVDYTTVPPTVATTSGVTAESSSNQRSTNGACNKNNLWLFNVNGVKLYAPQNTTGYPVLPNYSGLYSSYVRPEVAICPKPGSCDSFYLFYANHTYHAGNGCSTYELRYYLIDPDKFNSTTLEDGLIESAIPIFDRSINQGNDAYCPTPPAIALSKEKILGGIRTRQLFVLDYESVGGRVFYLRRYDITPSGISGPVTLYSHTPGFDDLHNFELELSPDGRKLAFGRSRTSTYPNSFVSQPDKDIVLYHLNDDGTLNTTLGTAGLTYIDIPHAVGYQESVIGLEFNAASSRLFASVANDAIWYVSNLTGTPSVSQMNAVQTKDFTYSQMELIYNNGIEYIAVAKNTSEIHRIENVSTGTPTISSSPFYSNANVSENTLYPVQSNGSTNKYLLCLPDQVDGDNYTGSTGGWFDPNKSANCCKRFYESAYKTEYAQTRNNVPGVNQFGNTNGEVVIENEFIVPAGVVCTLSNMTIRFHPQAKVTIQPTGQLFLQNGAHLTALTCGTTWKGVRIHGVSNQPHLDNFQGVLNMQTNAKISHAQVGAATWNLESGNLSTSGGKIQTNTANFFNNLKDLDIAPYPSSATNPSYNFCDLNVFKIDNDYRFGTVLDHRVTVKDIYRVYFRGSTFANDCTTSFMQASNVNTKAGILITDAYVIVDRKTSTTPCVFRSLYQGIWAQKLFVNQIFSVTNSQFNQNQMGIYSTGINNFIVTNNAFQVGNNSNFYTNTGLFVVTGTGFTIRDNTFTGYGNSLNTLPISYGCVIKNTCTTGPCADNAVFRNTFTNLCYANQSEGRNRGTADTDPGLVYFCNGHTNDLVDIRILRDPNLGAVTNQGIRNLQGTSPSGVLTSVQNTFSHNPTVHPTPNQWCDFWREEHSYLGAVNYYYDNTNATTINQTRPQYYSNTGFVARSPSAGKTCTVTNPFMLTIGQLLTDNGFGATSYETAKENYLNAKYLQSLLIDGGNQQSLKNQIDNTWNDDAWELRTELLSRSPNLSTEVLLHTAKKNVLPHALLFEVVLANIRSVKSPKAVLILENYLPEYMIEILKSSEEPSTYRKLLEEQLVNSQGQLSMAYQNLVTLMSGDTIDRSEALISLLNDVPLATAKLQLIDAYLAAGNTTEARHALTEYTSYFTTSENESLSKTNDFLSFIINKAGVSSSLNSTELEYLNKVASDSAHPYFIRAHNILHSHNLSNYVKQPLNPEQLSFKMQQVSNGIKESIPFECRLYPNPSKDYVTLELTYVSSSQLTAEIADLTGKVISTNVIEHSKAGRSISNINVQNLPNGTFALTIKDGDKKVLSKPFTKTE